VNATAPELPPPGAALVTVMLFGPIAAVPAMSIVTVAVVEFTTVNGPPAFTENPAGRLTLVTPLMNFVPVSVMAVPVSNRLPLVTDRLVSVGAGLLTVKFCAPEVPPPGAALVTVMLFAPVAAVGPMSMVTVAVVEFITVNGPPAFTENPAGRLTVVTPLMNFVPVSVMAVPVSSRFPAVTERAVSVGAGLLTVKVCAPEVPPPGAGLVTVMLFAPVAAVGPTSTVTVAVVEFTTVNGPPALTENPAGRLTLVTPLMNFVPVSVMAIPVSRRLPLVTDRLVRVSAGLLTVNVCGPEIPPPGARLATVMLFDPVAAVGPMSTVTVAVVELTTVNGPPGFIENPAGRLTPVTPLMNLVPVSVMAIPVSSRFPAVTERAVSVGAGLLTVKVCAPEVPPPGAALVTVMLFAPVAAVGPMSMLTVAVAEFTTVNGPPALTENPAGRLTVVTPLMKLVPVNVMAMPVSSRFPAVTERRVRVGAGFGAEPTIPKEKQSE